MKINVANPVTGCQKLFDIEDEKKLRAFMEKRIAQEVDASAVDDSLKGYVLRITGGNDKQGFPMMQGVLTNLRVRLLLDGRTGCFRRPTHDGQRKRRTVRGCIVGNDLAVLNTIIVKKGPQEIPGLTDKVVPRRLGPKRASKIRKLFNLSKEDDVRKYVVRRTVAKKATSKSKRATLSKAPKIQRLVTSVTLKRKRSRINVQKKHFARMRAEAAQYGKLLQQRAAESRKKRVAVVEAKREAAKAAREAAEKRKTRQVLKKIAQREAYAAKRKARTAVTSRKLSHTERAKAIKRRRMIEKHRKELLHRLMQMHAAAKRSYERAKKQMASFPSRQAVNHLRKVKQQRHELYLRIMSGARIPNLKRQAKHQEKVAQRKAARLAALAKKNRRKLTVAEPRKRAAKPAKAAPSAKKAKH